MSIHHHSKRLAVFGALMPSLPVWLALIVLSACYTGALAPNEVNLSPLFTIPLPQHVTSIKQVVDLDTLGHFAYGKITFGTSYDTLVNGETQFKDHKFGDIKLFISFIGFDSEKQAIDYFNEHCNHVNDYGKVYRAGQGVSDSETYRYCIPYLRRTSTDAPFVPGPWTSDTVAIQKNNFFISFNDYTDNPDRTVMNALIQQVADAMQVKIGK